MKKPDSSRVAIKPSSTPNIFRHIAVVMSLLGYAAFGLCVAYLALKVAYFALQIIGGIFLGVLMSSGESVAHSAVSPDNQITALVISDGCGITCGCTVRVDLKTDDEYIEEIWRGVDVCDATLTWVSATKLNILADSGGQTQIDMQALGLAP